MTTITIKNGQKLKRTIFENIEELQEYLFSIYLENIELSPAHTDILDKRLDELKENPANYISKDELILNRNQDSNNKLFLFALLYPIK